MDNFNIRKYLAEGRLKVNEGDMDHLMQDLERELKQHDWFYYMADDPRSYDKGTNEQRELKRLLKMLNNSPEAIALYNKYAPVQDGIDLRIKEEKRPDYPDVDKDGDTEESMEKALKDLSRTDIEEDMSLLRGASKETRARDTEESDREYIITRQKRDKIAQQLYKKDYKDLDLHQRDRVNSKQNPRELVNEEYNIGKGMEKDHDFDAMLAHALKLHAGTSIEDLKKVSNDFEAVNYHRENAYLEDAIDMLAAGKHEEFEDSLKLFKDEVEKTIRSFKESIKESLRAYNVIDIDGNVTHEGLSYEEALAKAKEVEGHKIRPTNMMLNENITQQDIDDIEASGNIDIAYKKAMKLLTSMLTKNEVLDSYDPDQEQLDDEDEIFMPMDDEGRPLEEALNPEVVKAVDRLIKALAKKYDYPERDAVFAIQAALKQRSFDNVNEDLDLGHQDDEPGMLKGDLYKIGKYSMELYQMMDDLEDIDGEVDLPHWWQSKVTTAKNMISGAKHYLEFELKEPAIDDMVTEDSLDDEAKVYFMQKVKRGEIDKLPEDPKAAFLAQMTKDQMDHDKETLDREGGLGESSFYTKDIKDKVVSKLMDQLKK